jgi:hypothetical protein
MAKFDELDERYWFVVGRMGDLRRFCGRSTRNRFCVIATMKRAREREAPRR